MDSVAANPLRLLLVEDSENDAVLVLRALQRGGFSPDCTRVDSVEQLQTALESGHAWDLIITDHNLPGFDSGHCLRLVRERDPDIPVIIVSGSIGEEIAVSAMRNGAQDYILKDNLSRLAPAIDRELRDHEVRRQNRQAQEAITHLALHDSLTGLINRHGFETRLKKALTKAQRQRPSALLYIDLDQFKLVNDTCGHQAGDDLLRQLASLLQIPVREHDTLARLGGDEFGVLLDECTLEQAEQVAKRMLSIVNDFRYTWGEHNFRIGASIGLTLLDDPDLSLSDVMRHADMACYAAKDKGRNRIHLFRQDDRTLMARHSEMQSTARINEALEQDRFLLYYQEIHPLKPDTPGHCEILLRMLDPSGEVISPWAFIPAAERYNLMPTVDRKVLDLTLPRIRQLLREGQVPKGYRWFINLSGLTLGDDAFLAHVTERLREHAIPPEALGFEITETAVIANLGNAVRFIQRMRDLGCHVALDDFGTGLSSFSYLSNIPADYIKIDGGFVRDMHENEMHLAIVEAINRIGHVAGLRTIAEFVETEGVRQRLAQLGVDYAQGYGIARPRPLPHIARQP